MANENIMLGKPNFCIGPQAGTYCSIDTSNYPVVLQIKNGFGSLVRTYDFYPQDVLKPEPYDYDDLSIESDGYYKPEPISIRYTGPRDQSAFYDGMVFYTLERRGQVYREYYTYERNPEPFGPYKIKELEDPLSFITKKRPEYNSNIIRKWVLDTINQRLVLKQIFYKNSNDDYWFDSSSFAVKHRITSFSDHVTSEAGEIEVTTTSGLKKYDFITLGPSSDTDNIGAMEEVYIHKIDGNTLTIRTYDGLTPPKYEYVEGDVVTIYNDLLLFSNPKPLIDEKNIAYGYDTAYGSLYNLDQTDYGNVTNVDYSGVYCNVKNAVWNQYFESLSFVKGSNLLHLDIGDYKIKRSQNITLFDPVNSEYLSLHDIDIKDETIYKLQEEYIRREDEGGWAIMNWDTYNFHEDSLLPYTASVTLKTSTNILFQLGICYITVIVRDQFGIGLINKNVWFTKEGDIDSSFIPTDGYMVTDHNGRAEIRYDAGSDYEGISVINSKVDGSNTVYGSEYINSIINLIQFKEANFNGMIMQYLTDIIASINIPQKNDALPPKIYTHSAEIGPQISTPYDASTFLRQITKYTAPHEEGGNIGYQFSLGDKCSLTPMLYQTKVPVFVRDAYTTFEQPSTTPPEIASKLMSVGDEISELKLPSIENTKAKRYVSQNFVSRHLTFGHTSSVSIDQYVFVQEAKPAMWSEKNVVDTDFWLRIRPFAYNLDPDTLIIRLKEDSYLGDGEWYEITDEGTITMFDAGGGLLGIDFYYIPPVLFHHNAIVYVDVVVYDTANIPNIVTVNYWFKLIADYRAPYIEKQKPSIEEYDVNIDTEISFDLKDEGAGADINTLEIFVNERGVTEYRYEEFEPGNYHILFSPPYDFHYGQEVNITVRVMDRSDNKNSLLGGWKFYCIESDGPWFNMDNTEPTLCKEGLKREQPVSMQVYAINDTGIAYDSIKIEVGGKYRNIKITPIVYRIL